MRRGPGLFSGRPKASQQNFVSSNNTRKCCNNVLISPKCGRLSANAGTKSPEGVMCVRQGRHPPPPPPSFTGKSVEKVEGVKRRRGAIEVRGRDAAEAALRLAAAAVQRARDHTRDDVVDIRVMFDQLPWCLSGPSRGCNPSIKLKLRPLFN